MSAAQLARAAYFTSVQPPHEARQRPCQPPSGLQALFSAALLPVGDAGQVLRARNCGAVPKT